MSTDCRNDGRDKDFSDLGLSKMVFPAQLLTVLATASVRPSLAQGHAAILDQPVTRTPTLQASYCCCFSGNPGPFPSGHQVTPRFWIKIPQLEAIHIQAWGHPWSSGRHFPELTAPLF